jgi:hypothetical protein
LPRLRVVFDTNVYRGIRLTDLEDLEADSKGHGIIAGVSFWVAQELLFHVATPADPAFGSAWSAVRKLVRHCAQFDGAQLVIPFVDTHDTVNRLLFDRSTASQEEADAYGWLLIQVANAKTANELLAHRDALSQVRKTVSAAETSFVEGMWETIILRLAPNAESWGALIRDAGLRARLRDWFKSSVSLAQAAEALVDISTKRHGLALDPAQRAAVIETALRLFPTPMHVLRLLVRKIALEAYNLSKPEHSNSLWDLQIAYTTSLHVVVEGAPLWVITNDGLLLQAAREAATTSVFRSVSFFRELVGRSTEEVIDVITGN